MLPREREDFLGLHKSINFPDYLSALLNKYVERVRQYFCRSVSTGVLFMQCLGGERETISSGFSSGARGLLLRESCNAGTECVG